MSSDLRIVLLVGSLGLVSAAAPSRRAALAQSSNETRSQERASTRDKENAEKRAEIARLKVLHQEVVTSLRIGKGLDEMISRNTMSNLATNAGYGAGTSSKNTYFDKLARNPSQLKYRDVLRADEEQMVLMGAEKVTVEIDAQPKHCQVGYVEVASGASHAFGETKASRKLDPKLYDFVCECVGTPVHAILDCTTDQSYTFECGNKAQGTP